MHNKNTVGEELSCFLYFPNILTEQALLARKVLLFCCPRHLQKGASLPFSGASSVIPVVPHVAVGQSPSFHSRHLCFARVCEVQSSPGCRSESYL